MKLVRFIKDRTKEFVEYFQKGNVREVPSGLPNVKPLQTKHSVTTSLFEIFLNYTETNYLCSSFTLQ